MATIKFPEGTSFREQFTLTDQTGVAVDLTGLTGEDIIFAAYVPSALKTGSPVAFLEKAIGTGIEITDATAGVFVVSFLPSETRDATGTYDWEIQLTELSGDIWHAGQGVLIIQPPRRLDQA